MVVEPSMMSSGVFGAAAQVGHPVPASRRVNLGGVGVSPVGRARVYVCGNQLRETDPLGQHGGREKPGVRHQIPLGEANRDPTQVM